MTNPNPSQDRVEELTARDAKKLLRKAREAIHLLIGVVNCEEPDSAKAIVNGSMTRSKIDEALARIGR